jgi:Lrp/AsnC family transcriptional regulator, leucine-responsive regulatory protein
MGWDVDVINQRTAVLQILMANSRTSYADIARQLQCSRAHARELVHQLRADGVIEQFTVILDSRKLGQTLSAFLDIQVAPVCLEQTATALAATQEVISLYIMSDLRSLHVHTLTDDLAALDAFVRTHLYGRDHILRLECKIATRRVKTWGGGVRP